MNWILIMIIIGAGGRSVAITPVEFSTEQRCIEAKKFFEGEIKGDSGYFSTMFTCLPK